MYNEIEPLSSPNGPMIQIGEKELINLSSNNYLGLATDSSLKAVAKEAIDEWGVGAGPSARLMGRLTCI